MCRETNGDYTPPHWAITLSPQQTACVDISVCVCVCVCVSRTPCDSVIYWSKLWPLLVCECMLEQSVCACLCVQWGYYSRWTYSIRIKECRVEQLWSLQTTYAGEWTSPVSEQLLICVLIFEILILMLFCTQITVSICSVHWSDVAPGELGSQPFRFSSCQRPSSQLRSSLYYLPAPNKTIANKQ